MSRVVRFGVSMSQCLLQQFDELVQERVTSNRSEAIRIWFEMH